MNRSIAQRTLLLSSAVMTLCSCQLLKKGGDGAGDAAVTSVSAEAGVTTTSAKGSAATPAKEAPVATTFELVAAGKKSGSKIVWLRPIGDRVWLSGMGLDAYADGDGPLATAPDLTQGLKQKQGEEYDYTGNGSVVFALRTEPDMPKSEDVPTVWTRDGKGPWSAGTKLPKFYGAGNHLNAWGFTRWKNGALFVSGQIASGTNMALFAPNAPGTLFETISPSGEIKEATFDFPKDVMAWAADSDGKTLSVVGYRAKNLKSAGISVFRGDDSGPLVETPIIADPGTPDPHSLFAVTVREHGTGALAYIKSQPGTIDGLDKLATTVFVIGDKSTEAKKIVFAPAGKGAVAAAAHVGDAVYATVMKNEKYQFFRAADGGEPAPVVLPSLAKGAAGFGVAKDGEKALTCEATNLFARKNDLWVQAMCSGQGMKVPAVFRLGHAQDPIALP